MVDLSVVVIVKNEAEMLPGFLAAHAELGAERLVVDTGSTDNSIELALEAGARVERVPWPGSFAAARNAALDLARGRWVLFLDADERVDRTGQAILQQMVLADLPRVFRLVQRSYTDDAQLLGWRPVREEDRTHARGVAGYFDERLGRLFPRRPDLRFEGIVHELIEPSAARAGLGVEDLPVILHHYREAQTPEKQQAKFRLYLELSRKKVEAHPGSVRARLELAAAALVLGRGAEALDALEPVAADAQDPELLEHLGLLLIQAGRASEARDRLRPRIDDAPEGSARGRLLALLGEAELALGEHAAAAEALEAAFASGETGFRVCVNLGVAAMEQARLRRARFLFRRALKQQPRSVLPHLNLGLVEKRLGNLSGARDHLLAAREQDPSRWEVHAHLAGLAFDARAFEEAAAHAERAVALEPHGADAHVRACAAALALGKDADALAHAEEAARRDPRHQSIVQQLQS